MSSRNVIKGKKLYNILFFGVIFTVVAVGSLALWGVREVRRDAAVVAVENSARGLSGAVTVLVNVVTSANDEIDTKVLKSLKPKALLSSFSTMFETHKVLASVMLSDAKGLRYMLTRRADGWLQTIPGRGDDSTTHWTFVNSDGSSRATDPETPFDRDVVDDVLATDFTHLEPGKVNWRSTYRFHDSGESWLTASSLVESGGANYMVSFVFPIDAVARHLGAAEKGSAEKIFLYWSSGRVLPIADVAEGHEPGGTVSKALSADKVSDPVIAQAAQRMASHEQYRKAPFQFTVNGEQWWAYVLPLAAFGDTMSLGVAVPKSNILSTLTSDTFLLVAGGILVLLAAVALFILHQNRSRIEAMGLRLKAAQTPEDVLLLIAGGENRTLEFKQTLRFNLKAGKNGKEIEHASMKTVAGFMNSEGGTLLVGVADNGVVEGFEEDKLGSDDKALLHFNNLVNQHIGTEFSRYMDTAIIEVQGKHIIRAYCMPAAAPAILKNGNNEEFYVRSGPASRQLTLSQFYEWLKEH
ncbi:MAG: ATP-binding protein [Pseudodesulfovibrio sp.]